MSKKRMLAIDPGFKNTGVAVLEFNDDEWFIIHTSLIKTEKSSKKLGVRVADDTVRRCEEIARALQKIIDNTKVSLFAVETPSGGGKSASAVKAMALATGVVSTVIALNKKPAVWCTPTDVKKATIGTKTASKLAIMDYACEKFPTLRSEYTHIKGASKGKLRNDFEHIADAIGVFEAVKEDPLTLMLTN